MYFPSSSRISTNRTDNITFQRYIICSVLGGNNGPRSALLSLTQDRDAIMEFMRVLPTRRVGVSCSLLLVGFPPRYRLSLFAQGIGKVTERILKELGITTCGDIREKATLVCRWVSDRRTFQTSPKLYVPQISDFSSVS